MSSERIKVRFEKSGGFAGLTKKAEIDSFELSSEEKSELTDLIKTSSVFDLKIENESKLIPDAEQFTIHIFAGDRSRQLKFTTENFPAELEALVSFLERFSHVNHNKV